MWLSMDFMTKGMGTGTCGQSSPGSPTVVQVSFLLLLQHQAKAARVGPAKSSPTKSPTLLIEKSLPSRTGVPRYTLATRGPRVPTSGPGASWSVCNIHYKALADHAVLVLPFARSTGRLLLSRSLRLGLLRLSPRQGRCSPGRTCI